MRKAKQARGPEHTALRTFQSSTDLVSSQPGRKEEQLCPIWTWLPTHFQGILGCKPRPAIDADGECHLLPLLHLPMQHSSPYCLKFEELRLCPGKICPNTIRARTAKMSINMSWWLVTLLFPGTCIAWERASAVTQSIPHQFLQRRVRSPTKSFMYVQLHRAATEHWVGLKRPQLYCSVLGLLEVLRQDNLPWYLNFLTC